MNQEAVDAWRDQYLKTGKGTVIRVKLSNAKFHHLAYEARPLRGESRTALCGEKPQPFSRWTRVIGQDPCCLVCAKLGAEQRVWIRPYRPES